MTMSQVNNVTVYIAPTPQPSYPSSGAVQAKRRWTMAASSGGLKGLIRRLTVQRRSSRQEEPSLSRDSRDNRVPSPGHQASKQASRNLHHLDTQTSPDACVAHGDREQQEEEEESGININISPPRVNIDKDVITCVRDTSETVERRTGSEGAAGREGSERPVTGTFKSPSFPSSTDLGGLDERRDVPRRETPSTGTGTGKLRKKNRTRTPFTATITRYKRTHSEAPKSIPSLTSPDELSRSMTTQPRDEEFSRTIPKFGADRPAKKASQTTTSSPIPTEEIEKLQHDLATSRSRVIELQKRCDAQSRDLERTNDFFHSADKSSDSDIIRALQRLNAEVQQETAYMVDCLMQEFVFKNVLTTNPTEEQISARRKAEASIGQALVQSFGTITPEDIPMFLEIAFQAFLTSALYETASSWTIEPGQNTFLNDIYQRLRRAEPQVISGLWRSLTRVHIAHHTCVTDPYVLVRDILVGLSDIVVAAGCTASRVDITSKVASKFENKVFSLVSLAGRLNRLFGEVISSDFEVFVVRPGEKFEGKQMEDDTPPGSGSGDRVEEIRKASVLCATQLGLMKQIPTGTLWEKGKKQKMMVLKARVLLESFLTTTDEE